MPRLQLFKGGALRAHARRLQNQARRLFDTLAKLSRENQNAITRIDEVVVKVRVESDAQVGRKRPWRGRPNREAHRLSKGAKLFRTLIKGHDKINRGRLVLVILDFGFGQRSLQSRAPVHRFLTAIQDSAPEGSGQFADFFRLIGRVHGEIRLRPIGQNTQALKLPGLAIHPLLRLFATESAHVAIGNFFALRTQVLADVLLNRQSMTVPAGNERGRPSRHRAVLDGEVFQTLVEHVSDVNVAIGVGRTIRQGEHRSPAVFLLAALVNVLRVPLRNLLRFALRKISLHRKICLRQQHAIFQGRRHRGASTSWVCHLGEVPSLAKFALTDEGFQALESCRDQHIQRFHITRQIQRLSHFAQHGLASRVEGLHRQA